MTSHRMSFGLTTPGPRPLEQFQVDGIGAREAMHLGLNAFHAAVGDAAQVLACGGGRSA
jgi:hypothetical protein